MPKTKRIPFNDKQLTALGPLKRYANLEATGITLNDLPIEASALEQVQRWREKIARVLISKDRVKFESRATEGYRVDTDEALEGESECFRMKRLTRPSPIKIGINLSGRAGSEAIQCIRGGAVLAFTDLCKKQGRKFRIEICYGNGINQDGRGGGVCHVRIPLPAHSTSIAHICLSRDTMRQFGNRVVHPLAAKSYPSFGAWVGFYRFSEFESAGVHEFDFVLDRVETRDATTEYQRVLDRLVKLGVA